MSHKYQESYDYKRLKRERALARADLRAKMKEAQAPSKTQTEQQTLAGLRRQEG
jgi:hypothetical protein